MINKALFTSKSDNWNTPADLFKRLDAEFGFTTDVCATAGTAKCAHHYTPQIDGLTQPWEGVCFMNPPFSKIADWMKKAHDESKSGITVVCLIPVRTDTAWWHDHVMFADEIRLIRGRLKFSESKNSAPFPSAVVVFNMQGGITPNVTSMLQGDREK